MPRTLVQRGGRDEAGFLLTAFDADGPSSFGVKIAGHDGVYPDLALPQFERQDLRNGVHRGLGCRVNGTGGGVPQGSKRADVDDASAGRVEPGHGSLRHRQQPENVRGENVLEVRLVNVRQHFEVVNGGIVHDDIKRAEGVDCARDHGFDLPALDEVSLHRHGLPSGRLDFRHDPFRAFAIAAKADRDSCTGLAEGLRDAGADPFRCARDQGDFVFQFLHIFLGWPNLNEP